MDQNEKSVPNHETQNLKSLGDILRELRDYAESLDYVGDYEPAPNTEPLRDIADRIEVAVIRERSKWERERRTYEKLHDCFWEENAIQNIVRQMLGASDDLRRVDPKESDDLEYFAHELMKAAKKRDATSGNAAALRSALEDTQDLLKHFTRNGGMLADAFALHMRDNDAALAAQPRNCDRSKDDAEAAFAKEFGRAWNTPEDELATWLFAKAEKKGGAQ